MNIEKIKELIFIIKDSSTNESTKKRAVADLKRLFGLHMHDAKTKGKRINPEIKKEIESLLSDYESLKNFDGVNEILSSIASEYIELANNNPNSPFMSKALDIHIKILGNPGTDSTGFSKDYIEKVIVGKLSPETSFNKLDIINVLREQGESLSEDFQDLIEEIVMPDIEKDINNPDVETRNLENPEILDVLSNLAASYKYDAEFEKVQEILEKALKLTQFKDDYLYKNLQRDFNEINFLNKNFETISIANKSLEDFKNTIKHHLGVESINSPTFVESNNHKPRPLNPTPPGPNTPAYKMPFDKKCEAIYRLIENLKKDFPDIELDELKVGKNKFDSYHIITLKNANFTILENFNESSEAIYFIDNDILYAALQETKTDAKAKYPNQISSANHQKDFEQYISKITEKASDKLNYSPVKKTSKRSKPTNPKTTDSKSTIESPIVSTEKTEIPSNPTEESKQDLDSIDLASLSPEELEKLDAEFDSKISAVEEEESKLKEDLQKLEEQRKQALIASIRNKQSHLNKIKTEVATLKTKVSKLQDNE